MKTTFSIQKVTAVTTTDEDGAEKVTEQLIDAGLCTVEFPNEQNTELIEDFRARLEQIHFRIEIARQM